jgi:MATE family multidrug resistance protein
MTTQAGLATNVLPGGSPYKAILRLAMPTVIAMLSQSVVNEVDVLFFAHLPYPESSNAQAALLPSLLLVWLFGGSLSAISVGTQALVARRYAERHYASAGAVLANAAWFTLIAGAIVTVVGILSLPFIVRVMTAVPEKADIMLAYTRWRLFGVISMAMTMAIKAFFDGIGKTYVHLVSALIMNAFNILFCWMFIFGHLGAPRMGAQGAGVGAVTSTWIGLAIMIYYGWAARAQYRPLAWSHISRKLTWDILKLSISGGAAIIAMGLGFGLFQMAADHLDAVAGLGNGSLPDEAVNSAATTDIVAILKLTFTACIGFGTATATLVGQSLGAKRPDQAQKYGWASVRLGLVLFGIVGLGEALFTPQLVAFITHSEAVRAAAMQPMRIMGLVTPIIAVAMILSEALFGAGNPKFVAVAQLVLVFGFLVPCAYALGIVLGFGLNGIWISAAAYSALAAITMTWKFRQGAWKTIKL